MNPISVCVIIAAYLSHQYCQTCSASFQTRQSWGELLESM